MPPGEVFSGSGCCLSAAEFKNFNIYKSMFLHIEDDIKIPYIMPEHREKE